MLLSDPDNWQEFGEVTPDEAAAAAQDVLYEYWDSVCETGGGDMELIGEIELDANTALIGFGNIPDTYKELELHCQLRTDRADVGDGVHVVINGIDSGTPYRYNADTFRFSDGTHSQTSSVGAPSWYLPLVATAEDTYYLQFAPLVLRLPNYSESAQRKSLAAIGHNPLSGTSVTNARMIHIMGFAEIYNQAIESVQITPDAGDYFAPGCRFRLYGLKGAAA